MSRTADEVIAIRMGTRDARRSDVFLNYDLYGEEDGPAVVDYYLWLVRHPDGPLLVDTGFAPRAGAIRSRTELRDVESSLRILGVEPTVVRHVIVTHAHYDHIGNLRLFPNATVHMAEDELKFWTSSTARHTQFSHYSEEDEIAALTTLKSEGRLALFADRAHPVKGVRVDRVGGHTPGQAVVRVQCGDSTVLLASDAIHFYEEWERDMPFTAVADLPRMFEIFQEFRAEQGAGFDVLVPGHDPAVLSSFPVVPEFPGGDAVSISRRSA